MKLNLPPDMKCCRKNIESGSKGENGISSLFTPENDIRLCHHMVLFQFHFTHLQNKGQTHTWFGVYHNILLTTQCVYTLNTTYNKFSIHVTVDILIDHV